MAALTFVQVLKSEVAKFQALHPEREGEIARAHALILHGQVLPSTDDPTTALVLSSDGKTQYRVNSHCTCQAGQHGKPCKHLQSWRLYQYVSKKMEAAPLVPLPEAPASVNCHLTIAGRQVQLTLRDTDETRLLQRLQTVLAQYPAPSAPAHRADAPQGEGWCAVHNVAMKQTIKDGRSWYSHKKDDGTWCKGTGR